MGKIEKTQICANLRQLKQVGYVELKSVAQSLERRFGHVFLTSHPKSSAKPKHNCVNIAVTISLKEDGF